MGVRIRSEVDCVVMEIMDGNGGVKVRERRRLRSPQEARAVRDIAEAIADDDEWEALAYVRGQGEAAMTGRADTLSKVVNTHISVDTVEAIDQTLKRLNLGWPDVWEMSDIEWRILIDKARKEEDNVNTQGQDHGLSGAE
jgi:hypothetical protein